MSDAAAWRDIDGLKPQVPLKRCERTSYTGCDPYLLWADVTTDHATGFPGRVAVLVELADAQAYDNFRDRFANRLDFIPGGLGQRSRMRFLTGFVTLAGLRCLVAQMEQGPVLRFTLQQSRTDFGVAGAYTGDLLQDRLDQAEANASWAEGKARANRPAGTFLGVIDNGFPFAAATGLMRDPDRPLCLWDQGWESYNSEAAPAGPSSRDDLYWQTAWGYYAWPAGGQKGSGFEGFLYGRELKTGPGSAAAQAGSGAYADSRYFDPVPRHTHGAAVLGLAAPWSLHGGRAAWPDHVSGLALVQLPTRTVDDTSGGSLAMRVLDGLRYILWQEELTRAPGSSDAVVVNASYGVQAGPHDGSSMFERAVGEMLEEHKRLHVVLPAGNSHLAGCHARRTLAGGESGEFKLFVLPDNPSDTHVELWLPFDAQVAVSIQPPHASAPLEPVCKHGAKVYGNFEEDAPSRIEFAVSYPDRVAQSDKQTMVLVSIGSTRNDVRADGLGTAPGLNGTPRRAVLATPGLWRLTVANKGEGPVTVDAWIEREDASVDRAGGSRQAYFPDSGVEELRQHNARPEGTLNGIATLQHKRVHVVGASQPDGQMARYSAAGEPGQGLPSAVAAADWSWALPGLTTRGFAPGAVTRVNGTSAASAVFARQLTLEPIERSMEWPVEDLRKDLAPSRMPSGAEQQPEAPRRLRGPTGRPGIPFDVFSQDA